MVGFCFLWGLFFFGLLSAEKIGIIELGLRGLRGFCEGVWGIRA